MWSIEICVMLAMILLNSIFAGYEIALASVSAARLQVFVREGRRGARAALVMKNHIERSLAVVQLGITLVGAIAAATGGAGAEEILAPHLRREFPFTAGVAEVLAILLIVVPLTIITITFGELIPKVFALRNKEWLCLRLSPAMRWFTLCVRPVVCLFEVLVHTVMCWSERCWHPNVSDQTNAEASELQELRAMATMARGLRLIGSREEKIILGAAALSKRPVHAIMLPAGSMSMLYADDSLMDSLIRAHLDLHTRFPVTSRPNDPQAVVGYVNFKDIIALMRLSPQNPSLRAIVRPIPDLSDSLSISGCLETLMREHTHIALIRNRVGAVVGMITLEDILEELVGDIEDEFDRLPTHVIESGSGWVVGGGISLTRLRELTGTDLGTDPKHDETKKLTEWISEQLKRPARGGDIVEHGDSRVAIRKVRRQNVLEAQITNHMQPS